MQTIPITVSSKIASVPCGTTIVADNTDYQLQFAFDEEWSGYALKTARILIDGQYTDIDFEGNTVTLPPVPSSAYRISIGVYAGELSTTTPAQILVLASVLGTQGTEYTPSEPTVLPDIDELALDDTFVVTDVSEGEKARATIGQVVDYVQSASQIEPADTNPLMDGEANVGSSDKYAREDHQHPTDTSRASVDDFATLAGTVAEKQDTLTAGTGISIVNNVISATGGGRFPVTYGETTYAAIAAAYAAGMIPECDRAGDIYTLTALYVTRAVFRQNNLVGTGGTVNTIICTSENVWSVVEADYYNADQVDALAQYAVKYSAQTLTAAQQAQARNNIGAASLSDIGTVFTIKGEVTNVSDLPATGNVVGDVYFVSSVHAGYVWLETTDHPNGYWEELGEPIDLSAYRTAAAQDVIDGAQDTAIAAKYAKPSGGIPKTDLASDVQTSLGKADTALQTAPVSSVNGQTGTVVLDAADVGATETFTVTITYSNDSYFADKTFAEISTAYAAGKRLMAAYPILFRYGDTLVPVTIYSLLVPAIYNSQIIGFASYVDTQQSGIYYHHELNIANDSVDVSTTLKTSDALPSRLGTASAGHSYQFSRDDHVHPMPTAADVGAEPAVTETTVTTAGAVTQALDAGKMYHFTGALTSLTLTLNAASGVPAHYHFDFTEGSTAFDPVLPNGVVLPDNHTWEADTHYEVDILNNYAVVVGWAVSA